MVATMMTETAGGTNSDNSQHHHGIQAAAEAAARVNAMLIAKGVMKAPQPLLVNDNILKSKTVRLLLLLFVVSSQYTIC